MSMTVYIRTKGILLITLVLVWNLVCSNSMIADAQKPGLIAERTKASLVLLEMKDSYGRSSQGSGFFVGDRLVATNFHVINGAKAGTVKLVSQAYFSKPQRYVIEGTVALDKARDLAIVKVTTLNAPPLPLGDSDIIEVGDIVYAVGNPRGLEGTFSSGEISNILPQGSARIKGKMLQFTAAISRGSSGGVVVNSSGEVIGIVSETRDDGQNLNFAIPVNALKSLITSVGPVRPFPNNVRIPGVSDQILLPFVFLIMGGVVFLAVWFLPIVKLTHLKIAVLVAVGFGALKTIFTSFVRSDSFPMGVKSFFSSKPPNDILHALGCEECIVDLVSYSIKFPAYTVFIAFLLGFTNLLVEQFELEGFFKTFSVAVVIVSGEYLLYLFFATI